MARGVVHPSLHTTTSTLWQCPPVDCVPLCWGHSCCMKMLPQPAVRPDSRIAGVATHLLNCAFEAATHLRICKTANVCKQPSLQWQLNDRVTPCRKHILINVVFQLNGAIAKRSSSIAMKISEEEVRCVPGVLLGFLRGFSVEYYQIQFSFHFSLLCFLQLASFCPSLRP